MRAPGLAFTAPGVRLIEPLGLPRVPQPPRERGRASLTDSGGIQEETTYLGVPCFTLRDNTERPVTCALGTNVLLGLAPERIAEVPELTRGGSRRGAGPSRRAGTAPPPSASSTCSRRACRGVDGAARTRLRLTRDAVPVSSLPGRRGDRRARSPDETGAIDAALAVGRVRGRRGLSRPGPVRRPLVSVATGARRGAAAGARRSSSSTRGRRSTSDVCTGVASP